MTRGSGRGCFHDGRLRSPVTSWQLPKHLWPERDRQAWLRACSSSGPLSVDGKSAHLARDSIAIREAAYGKMLSFLQSVNALDPEGHIGNRMTPALLTGQIALMRTTMSAHSIRASIYNLHLVFEAMLPKQDFGWMMRHPYLPRLAEVRASKKQVTPPDPAVLLAHACRDAQEAHLSGTPIRAALMFRNAVMMMVLVTHAIRLKNLAEMLVGEHLTFHPTHLRLNFEHSIKNREVVDVILTDNTAAHMRRYFDLHRNVLLRHGPDHGAVWVNIDGNPLRYSTIGQLVTKITTAWGHPMSPHGARYALATTTMNNDPRDIAAASAALAHRGTRSVNQVYDRSGSLGAQASWAKIRQDLLKR